MSYYNTEEFTYIIFFKSCVLAAKFLQQLFNRWFIKLFIDK